jgi:hypothetical protein
MLIVTVCRSGPEYGVRQAQYLHNQLKGRYDSVCMTDLPEIPGVRTQRLHYPSWPGWWAKMELFDVDGVHADRNVLYLDLDTKIVGSLDPLMRAVESFENLVMLRDFYKPERLASGVMLITPKARLEVWSRWRANTRKAMMENHPGGDGRVIEKFSRHALAWQDILPHNSIVSFKMHVVGPDNAYHRPGRSKGDGTIPAGALLVCYHGNPRPWTPNESHCRKSSDSCLDAQGLVQTR